MRVRVCAYDASEGRGDVRDAGKGLRRGGVQRQERRDKERTDETTGAGEKEITAGSDRVVEINVARLIGATEECACGLSGSQLAVLRGCLVSVSDVFADDRRDFSMFNRMRVCGINRG